MTTTQTNSGPSGRITVIETGSGHHRTMIQQGRDEDLTIEQHGRDHNTISIQRGHGERLTVKQDGTGATASVWQDGGTTTQQLRNRARVDMYRFISQVRATQYLSIRANGHRLRPMPDIATGATNEARFVLCRPRADFGKRVT